jgi:hypothetical protein
MNTAGRSIGPFRKAGSIRRATRKCLEKLGDHIKKLIELAEQRDGS